jgi:hypothetical protein
VVDGIGEHDEQARENCMLHILDMERCIVAGGVSTGRQNKKIVTSHLVI